MIIECGYTEPPHIHEYPDDWIFGGPDGLHPGGDSHWLPTTYLYYDARANCIWTTQVPLCDDQALDECTLVASRGADFNPVWVAVKRPDGSMEMLPWTYDKSTDILTPKEA